MSKSLKKDPGTGDEKKKLNGIIRKSRSTGKTAQEIVNRHVHDKNDVITEEDFKNVNINAGDLNDTSLQPLQIPNDAERPKDEQKDHKVITPWDVISE